MANPQANFDRMTPIIIRDLLKDFPNLKPIDTFAITGNLGHESLGYTAFQEINPTVPGSAGGWGWAQWTGMKPGVGRRWKFMEFAKANGLDPHSYAANYGFLKKELKGEYAYAITAVVNAKPKDEQQSLLEAKVIAFERAYEKAGVKHYASRLTWAERAQKVWGSTPPVEPEKPPQKPPVEPVKKGPWAILLAALMAVVGWFGEHMWVLYLTIAIAGIGGIIWYNERKK